MPLNENDFTYSRTAISLVAERLGSQDKAAAALSKDLALGFIRGVGYPSQKRQAVMLTAGLEVGVLRFVPDFIWSEATAVDKKSYDWREGNFSLGSRGGPRYGAPTIWRDVRFETVRLPDVGNKRSTQGRKRLPVWGDWVAAVAVLAVNNKISGQMEETKLLTEIADQMAEWGIDELGRPTVGATVKQILKRLKEQEI